MAGERRPEKPTGLLTGEARALTKRGIHEETCALWGYHCGTYHDGRPVQIAPYYDGNAVVAQKLRFPDKSFKFIGDTKRAGLFGQHLWRDGGKMVVVTEGEIDALSVSQIDGNKWPVVSVPNGAAGARKALAKQIEWLNGFDSVILMFDNDDAGQTAINECVSLFPPGKCKVARLPLKDANEMLLAGRGAEVVSAKFGAKVYRPDGIVTLKDIREKVKQRPVVGYSWWLERLTQWTYGRRLGEIYGFGAGTGVGKTDMFTQQIAFDLKSGYSVGLFYLEQNPDETMKRVAGKMAGRRFHVPDGSWTEAELDTALDAIEGGPEVFLYDNFGACQWDNIRDRIRFLAHSEGVKLFYLDHLTALAAAEDDERTALERITSEMAALAKELNIIIHFISHLATPDGTPHEEGGRVMIRHFKGSRAIGFWSHYMFGLERDQQSDDVRIKTTTTFRCLKDRYTGQATGKLLYLGYDVESGLLYETEDPEKQDKPTEGSTEGEF